MEATLEGREALDAAVVAVLTIDDTVSIVVSLMCITLDQVCWCLFYR